MAVIPVPPAELRDVDAIVRLVNQAFVAERPYIEGERVNSAPVLEILSKGKFLLLEGEGRLAACVYIERRGPRAHLGLVSVDTGVEEFPHPARMKVPFHFVQMAKSLL